VLVAVADPVNGNRRNLSSIPEGMVMDTLLHALPREVHLDPLHPVTLTSLEERLRDRRKRPVDILHLVAHGIRGNGEIALWLEDDVPVVAERLAEKIGQVPLEVVVLVACEGGTRGGQDGSLPSFGETLLDNTDVAAVIAMREPIQEMQAQRFTMGLYPALLGSRDGPIGFDIAANEGRATMFRDGGEAAWHWAAPVLFWRGGGEFSHIRLVRGPASQRRDRAGWPDEYHVGQGRDSSQVWAEESPADATAVRPARSAPQGLGSPVWLARQARWGGALRSEQGAARKSYGYQWVRD